VIVVTARADPLGLFLDQPEPVQAAPRSGVVGRGAKMPAGSRPLLSHSPTPPHLLQFHLWANAQLDGIPGESLLPEELIFNQKLLRYSVLIYFADYGSYAGFQGREALQSGYLNSITQYWNTAGSHFWPCRCLQVKPDVRQDFGARITERIEHSGIRRCGPNGASAG